MQLNMKAISPVSCSHQTLLQCRATSAKLLDPALSQQARRMQESGCAQRASSLVTYGSTAHRIGRQRRFTPSGFQATILFPARCPASPSLGTPAPPFAMRTRHRVGRYSSTNLPLQHLLDALDGCVQGLRICPVRIKLRFQFCNLFLHIL